MNIAEGEGGRRRKASREPDAPSSIITHLTNFLVS